ncbi:hypothetical protein Taro_021631 [Colocasia esculenta]|uniref:Retrotransposon gag domain-containing protein n=1 Tax=Colocasia esculenta TaxID=4460 RepID=A0A843V5X8_COLES|nr:hypothetical protein [Colocasia esculenta]
MLVPCGNRYLYPVWVMVCGGTSYTSLSGVDVELCFVEVVWCDLPHNVFHPPSGPVGQTTGPDGSPATRASSGVVSLTPPAPQKQHAEPPPIARRTPVRQANSPRRAAAVQAPTRSDVDSSPHASGRKGSAHADQELVRRLRRITDLERRMDAMIRKAEGRLLGDDDLDFRSPFTVEILEAWVSPKLPLPSIVPYDGTTDPTDHVHGFESHMVFHGASDAAKCRSFPTTLKEAARAWFEALPAGSISAFHQLKKSFRDHFLAGRSQPRTTTSLLSVRQKNDEALWDYIQRFRTEALRIPRLDVSLATSALIRGTRDGFLQRTLGVQQPPTLADLLFIAQCHAACEESLAVSRAEQAGSPRNGKDLIRSFGFSEEVSTSCLPSATKPYREPDM